MPIEGAKVEIYKNDELIYTGYTDAYGKFNKMLEAGTYLIKISKSGYLTVEKTETLTSSTEIMVNLPSELKGLPLDMTPPLLLLKDYTLESTDEEISVTTTIETEVA